MSARRRGTRLSRAAVAAIAIACCGGTRAAIYVVTANPDLTFTPATITIHQGDTIAFQNAGGVHNVHADNNRFICSVNCTTNNAPNAAAWRADVQFRQLGTFGYYCDAHGDLSGGMRGTVTVIDRIFIDGFETAPAP